MHVYHEAEAISAELPQAVHMTQVLVEQLKEWQVQQTDAGLLILSRDERKMNDYETP